MPKEDERRKELTQKEIEAEKFRTFFSTSVAQVPEAMSRREEEETPPKRGLFGGLFRREKPESETKEPAERGLELPPTGEIVLGDDAEEPQADLELVLEPEEAAAEQPVMPVPKKQTVPATPEKAPQEPAKPEAPVPEPVKPEEPEDEYSYDDAILRHKMALLCTVVKQGKNSEKAYTCLKLAWLVRDKRNELKKSGQLPEKDKISLMKEERDLLENAYDGLEAAYSKEEFPMCGMDRFTLDLLMGEVAYRIGKFQKASRHVNQLLGDRATPSRVKDKALDLKESIQKHIQK